MAYDNRRGILGDAGMSNGEGIRAPQAKLAEVQRLATALAARVRYAQLVGRPVYDAQITALVSAARLMDAENAPWPPMVEEVLTELARSLDGAESAPEESEDP